MIPNIFVSSTISDLQYLRDGLRDAIDELCYHPVMSEHGEVGYLNPNTAAESCLRGVRQCQMMVLIVGKRYGSTSDDGLSVTHKEFLAAKGEQVPVITFVEAQILNYKEVFHADPDAQIWDDFVAMDNPRKTFQLLDEISASETFNAIIPFSSVGDAKKKLKLQIADFVGDRLSDTVLPMTTQLRDVFAEITTVRNMLVHSSDALQAREKETKRYLAVTRFLLNENAAEYRRLLEKMFGDLDTAISQLAVYNSFEAVLTAAEYTHEIIADDAPRNVFFDPGKQENVPAEEAVILGNIGMHGSYTLHANKHLKLSKSIFVGFDNLQKALSARIKEV